MGVNLFWSFIFVNVPRGKKSFHNCAALSPTKRILFKEKYVFLNKKDLCKELSKIIIAEFVHFSFQISCVNNKL